MAVVPTAGSVQSPTHDPLLNLEVRTKIIPHLTCSPSYALLSVQTLSSEPEMHSHVLFIDLNSEKA